MSEFYAGFHSSGNNAHTSKSYKMQLVSFGDSAQELNALVFAFKSDIAQYEHGK